MRQAPNPESGSTAQLDRWIGADAAATPIAASATAYLAITGVPDGTM